MRTQEVKLSNKGDGVYATADGAYIAERNETMDDGEVYWLVKRCTSDGFGEIITDTETLREARALIAKLVTA